MQFKNRFIETKPQMDVCNGLWLNYIYIYYLSSHNFFTITFYNLLMENKIFNIHQVDVVHSIIDCL